MIDHSVWSILTYNNSIVDIFLNYIATIISLWAVILSLWALPRPVQRWFWLPLSAFLFIFQVVLCLWDGCSGISIVWCAYLSFFIVIHIATNEGDQILKRMRYFVYSTAFIYDLALIVYYAVMEEPITTVAHVCAVLMGALIAGAFLRFFQLCEGNYLRRRIIGGEERTALVNAEEQLVPPNNK